MYPRKGKGTSLDVSSIISPSMNLLNLNGYLFQKGTARWRNLKCYHIALDESYG